MAEDLQEAVIASSSRVNESVSSSPCVICRRQFARYTCPKCNIPYCSLVCFRSEKHDSCSESFYRREIELDVKSAPSTSTEEKRKMMELLKRFEEDSLDDSPLLEDSDNEEEMNDLDMRLQSMDLDAASYDELWNALTPAEQDKFVRAMNDPNSELAQRLLSSELDKVPAEPWWELQPPNAVHAATPAVLKPKRGAKPTVMELPEPLVKQACQNATKGPLLLYNICALCVVYAYAVRHFSVSSLSTIPRTDLDYAEVRQSISRLAPFLVDRRSTTVHLSVSDIINDLWSRFPASHVDSRLFSLLLRDAAIILRPAAVTVIASNDCAMRRLDLEEHPNANAFRVLSDLALLFTLSPSGIGKPSVPHTTHQQKGKQNHIGHKLTFYAAYIIGTPAPMLHALADEATMRANILEKDSCQTRQSEPVKRVNIDKEIARRIEELS